MMNRAHNSAEAQKCLKEATKYFDNISIDLIYGVPGMSNENGDKISSKHSLSNSTYF
jgi:coproporphyrinogen III oxidase-like Fe-S oxidoreductase